MRKAIPFFLLFVFAASLMSFKPHYNYYGGKTKKKTTHKKKKKNTEYAGPLTKVYDAKSDAPYQVGFGVNGHYQFSVIETVTPTIHMSGIVQPKIHVCVEGVCKGQKDACIDELANGYGNMYWEADATTKCYLVAYRPDGKPIPIKKELLVTKPKPTWKGNDVTWEDGEYKVHIKIAKCKVVGRHICICPH